MNVKVTTWLLLLSLCLCSNSSATDGMEKVEAEGNLRGLAAKPWNELSPPWYVNPPECDPTDSKDEERCESHCAKLEPGFCCDTYSMTSCANKRGEDGKCYLVANCKENCPGVFEFFKDVFNRDCWN